METALLLNLGYPYGKPQIYEPRPLIVVGEAFRRLGFKVELIDLNIDSLDSVKNKIRSAVFVATSPVGSPSLPSTIRVANHVQRINPDAKVLIGGQVIEGLFPHQFKILFGEKPIQAIYDARMGVYYDKQSGRFLLNHTNKTLLEALGVSSLPDVFELDLVSMYESLPDRLRKLYFEHEKPFFLSNRCRFDCDFCGALKGVPEKYRSMDAVETDLRYLTGMARKYGTSALRFYVTNLDMFQTPRKISEFLTFVNKVSAENNIVIKVRGLSCIPSFLSAQKILGDEFPRLLVNVTEIACGFDGTDKDVWDSENKGQNDLSKGDKFIRDCRRLGPTPGLLMVLGFPSDNIRTLAKTVWYSIRKCLFEGALARPYLAKPFIPKNKGWVNELYDKQVWRIVTDPNEAYELDFADVGSPLTHPRRWHRWASNLAYLTIIAILTPFGKNTTFPLLPQGGKRPRWRQKLIEWINRKMPFDR